MDYRASRRTAAARLHGGRSRMDRRQSVHLSRCGENARARVDARVDHPAGHHPHARVSAGQRVAAGRTRMNVAVFGLWHLGTVTAACLAEAGHDVTGLDPDRSTIDRLSAGTPPLFEPGLEDLVKRGIAAGRLRFTTDV